MKGLPSQGRVLSTFRTKCTNPISPVRVAQRFESTSTSSSSAGNTTSSQPQPTIDTIPRNDRRRHRLFYRDVLPPLLRVLGYGSAVYFALHLTWQYLNGREQAKLEKEVKEELEREIRQKAYDQDTSKVGRHSNWLRGWFSWGSKPE